MLLLGVAEAEEDGAAGAEVGGQECHRRVGAHPEVPPCVKAGVPEKRDLASEVFVVYELLGITKIVLGAQSNNLNLVGMFSGELPDL